MLLSMVFGLCLVCCFLGMFFVGFWKRFVEKCGLQWFLDEGVVDGWVLYYFGEEKQEYENNRIVEKEWFGF